MKRVTRVKWMEWARESLSGEGDERNDHDERCRWVRGESEGR